MADLSPPHQPPPPPTSSANFAAIDSDDISSLLHTLLQSSSQQHGQQPRQFPGSSGFHDNSGLLDPSFAYPGPYYGSGALSVDGVDDGDAHFHSEEDLRGKSASGRNSSKRSRAAEVHNMSEKRRRQRINEKMKALQKLIPNSNKTDKASMLDEAIEYLKQLQLQVQMLTFKNGSSSHPYYLQPAMQLPSVGPLDEGNSSRAGSFTADQEASMQAMLNLSSKPASCDYKLLMARMSENNTSGQAYAPQSSMNLHYRPLNDSMPSKVLCKDPVLPQLQLDMSQYGQSSSSGVSS